MSKKQPPYKRCLEALRIEAQQLRNEGHYAEAVELHKQIRARLSDNRTSSEYRQATIDYAQALASQEQYATAIEAAQEALKITLSDRTLATRQDTNIYELLYFAHNNLKNYLCALACLEQGIAIYDKAAEENIMPPTKALLPLSLMSLFDLSLKTNNLEAAERSMSRLLKDLCVQTIGARRVADLLENLVERLVEDQDYLRAQFWSRKKLRLYQRHLYEAGNADQSFNYGKALHRLATICKKLGKVRAARVLYKAHLKVVGPHLGSQYSELSATIAGLFELDQKP